MRRSILPWVLATVATVPPAALAQEPAPLPAQFSQSPPGAPKPEPAAGQISIAVRGGQATKRARYVAAGTRLRVIGTSRPFVPGQSAVLAIYRGDRLVATRSAAIHQARGGGRVDFGFTARQRGLVKLVILHGVTPTQGAFRSRVVSVRVIAPQAGQGARGLKVLLLQRGLRRLGFAVPVTGSYGGGTSRAVLAFRKTNRLGRNGYAGKRVFSLVLRGRGAFRARYPRAGRHVEFDWSRQVLAMIDRGRARRVYHASSGKASTPTVFGTFRFYRKEPGTNSHGMLHSNYFIGGYAIHGYPSVPNYPASHGCIRVPIPNAADINRQISLGETIFVYR